MSLLSSFTPPANQMDLPTPGEQDAFTQMWNVYLGGFCKQGVVGNPWQVTNETDQTYYYDPLVVDTPTTSISRAINWPAFPQRISYYFSSLSQQNKWALADTGYMTDGTTTFGQIPVDPCNPTSQLHAYGPYGPRGWQDEYCEWSVTRDPTSDKITRVDFTCENPEYWYTLWRIDPDLVVSLYQTTLGNPNIQGSDLCLYDQTGQVVIDPSTGSPAYNPLNIWNSGTNTTPAGGGAMHLTSTPNTLQTEIVGLAAGATVQRTVGNNDPQVLICCAQYGQAHRGSDPHIGQVTNQLVGAGFAVTVTNPPGLYIQTPNFAKFKLPANAPAGAAPADYWTPVRGRASALDQNGNPIPGNMFLHCVYEVPPGLGFTVGDIEIQAADGVYYPIQWGAQIIDTILMEINATAINAAPAPQLACVGTPASPTAQPFQIMPAALWDAYYATPVDNPVGQTMSLASNTVILPPTVYPGQVFEMVLTAVVDTTGGAPTVSFIAEDGTTDDIDVAVQGVTTVTYAVPGNTYPGPCQAVRMSLTIKADAASGLRSIQIADARQAAGPPAPSFLFVAPSVQPGTAL